jgi:hypothetical protein
VILIVMWPHSDRGYEKGVVVDVGHGLLALKMVTWSDVPDGCLGPAN